jgi:hypothetical protein
MSEVPLVREVARRQIQACAMSVVDQLKKRMGETDVLRSLGIVSPQIFDHFDQTTFDGLLDTFCEHFGASKAGHNALVNAERLKEQRDDYETYCQARVQHLLPESEVGNVPRVVQFWRSMAQFDIIPRKCSEWIIVAKLALTMVSGSVSDGRAFSAMNSTKNDLRNRLDTNLEACLLVYMQDLFTTATFPYGELQESLKSM